MYMVSQSNELTAHVGPSARYLYFYMYIQAELTSSTIPYYYFTKDLKHTSWNL